MDENQNNAQAGYQGYQGFPGSPGYFGYPCPIQEEDDFDFLKWLKKLWAGRRTVIVCLAIFTVLGFASALLKPKRYEVEAIIVPQSGSSTRTSSLSSLAALAGFSLDLSASSELSPVIYPKIVNSVPFKLQLLNTPLHFEEFDEPVAMIDLKEKHVPTFAENIRKYTLGLPGTLLVLISGQEEDTVSTIPSYASQADYIVLSPREAKMCRALEKNITLSVDKKEGYLSLKVIASEPRVAAELGQCALSLLQEEIIRFKVENSQAQLDFVQNRYNEVKAETEALQEQVARFTDKSKDLVESYSQLEKIRVQNKYNISYSVYQELAKQLEQAKLQVKTDTPTFSVVKPIVEPTEDMDSGIKTLIVFMFLGGLLGCGIILGKEYLNGLKEKMQDAGKAKDEKKEE